jgi:hypothetical protein
MCVGGGSNTRRLLDKQKRYLYATTDTYSLYPWHWKSTFVYRHQARRCHVCKIQKRFTQNWSDEWHFAVLLVEGMSSKIFGVSLWAACVRIYIYKGERGSWDTLRNLYL